MLGLLKPKTAALTPTASADESRLESASRISHVLRSIVNSHALLSVEVGGRRDPFCSALLAVDRESGHIIIDEPNDASREPVSAGDVLCVSARIDGVRVRFDTTVRALGSDQRGGYFNLAFPDSIEYEQRRAHHRAPATSAASIAVVLHDDDGEPLETSLRDLSIGGMSVRIAGGEEWTAGRTRVACTLKLPDQKLEVECQFEVRRKGRQGKLTLLAGRFHELDHRSRAAIERCVAELEREQLRKRQ